MQDTGYRIKKSGCKIQDARFRITDKKTIMHRVSWLMNRASCIVHHDKKGITLIEMVIGMVLVGIVALVVANALSTGITGFFVVDYRKEALDQARIAMDRMAKEMRNVRSSSATDLSVANASTFTFNDTSGTSISFALSGSNITRNTTSTLATGISTIGDATFPSGIFRYVLSTGTETQTPSAAEMLTIKRIKMGFKATAGSESITLQTEVWPRNL